MTKEEFISRLDVQPNGCWNWTGSTFASGYGQVRHNGNNWRTHRLAYLLLVGQPPPILHHTCRPKNNRCCNPAHLKPKETQAQHLQEHKVSPRKETCLRGHPLTGPNLYTQPSTGNRFCRACNSAAGVRWRQRKKKADNPPFD